MNKPTLPESIRTTVAEDRGGIWQWLIDPLPRRWLLPITGLWILGLDWLLFAKNALVLGLATPVLVAVGFLAGSAGTYLLQRRFANERGPMAWFKALVAGAVVGVPLPVVGTVVGAWILVVSGLASFRDRLRMPGR